MAFQKQMQWGGILMIAAALLVSVSNALFYIGIHSVTLHMAYSIGFTGLILTCTLIHLVQARRAGIFEFIAYLITVLGLAYVNIASFLDLVEMADIEGTEQAVSAIRSPILFFAIYGLYFCLMLFFLATAQVGVLPRWGAILAALGIALQLPAQFAASLAGPMFYIFSAGGSVIFGVGLIWIGLSLWSSKGWDQQEAGLSNLDRKWGGPVVIFAGLMFMLDAMFNMLGGLSLISGITHVISYAACMLIGFLLYAAHGKRVGWAGFAGFFFTQFGAALYIITAFLIMAQLAGIIENNRALMASWVDIPVGRYGGHMVTLGMFLFGIEAIRSGVFPRWSGWLVLIGIALALPFAFTIQDYFLGIFWVIGAILEGIGVVGMGWTILSKKHPETNVQLIESTA